MITDTDIDEKDEAEVETSHTKAKDIYTSTKSKIEKVLDAHETIQNQVQNPNQGSNSGPAKKSVKIEELLKPREPLVETMTLEEAQHWIKRYEAFLEHNKDVLNNEGIKVSWAILTDALIPSLQPDFETT